MKRLRLLLIVPIALQLSACEKQEAPMPPADAVVARRIDIATVDADTQSVKLTKGTSCVKAVITYIDGSSETLTKNVTAK